MFRRINQAQSLTVNQIKIVGTAMLANMLDFFDYYLIGFVLAFTIEPWQLSGWQSAIILLSSGMGTIIGSFMWGKFADIYGRKPAFLLTVLNFAIPTGLIYFTPEKGWIYLSAMRFFVGVGFGGLYCVDTAVVQEFTPVRMRGFITGLISLSLSVGVISASFLSAFVASHIGWRALFLIGLTPALLTLIIRAWVPESPYWLMGQGRKEEARRSIAWALRVPPETLPLAVQPPTKRHVGWRELLKYPRSLAVAWLSSLGLHTAAIGVILWAPTLLVLQLSVTPAEASYLYFLASLAGMLGRVVFSILSELIGRRRSGILIGFGATFCIAAAGIWHDAMLGTISFFWLMIVAAEFFYNGGSAVIIPYACEVWPSHLRASGMGSAYGFGSIGRIIGPMSLGMMVGTAKVTTPMILPYFLYLAAWMVLCTLAFIIFSFETRGRSLSDIDEVLQHNLTDDQPR
jgi:putative MFS transporter